jgi:hypothetical protein
MCCQNRLMLLVDGDQHHFLFWIIMEILENGLNLMKIQSRWENSQSFKGNKLELKITSHQCVFSQNFETKKSLRNLENFPNRLGLKVYIKCLIKCPNLSTISIRYGKFPIKFRTQHHKVGTLLY